MLGKIEMTVRPSLPTGGGEVTSGGKNTNLANVTKNLSRVVTSTYKNALHACKRAGITTQACDNEVIIQRSIQEINDLAKKPTIPKKDENVVLRSLPIDIMKSRKYRKFILRLRGSQIPDGSMNSGRRKGRQQRYGYRIPMELVPKTT